ncbi:hypothetical protein [Rhodoplanes sp. SY1]|uniref:hypothetical protein n=1 Tax=Rhodoplanes sp. SY1 TaxID=3166646 RepID=UPI0038B5A8A2
MDTNSTASAPAADQVGREWRDRVAYLAADENRTELIELLGTMATALDMALSRSAAIEADLITTRGALDALMATVEQATRDARRLSDEAARIRLTNAITHAVREARAATRPTS